MRELYSKEDFQKIEALANFSPKSLQDYSFHIPQEFKGQNRIQFFVSKASIGLKSSKFSTLFLQIKRPLGVQWALLYRKKEEISLTCLDGGSSSDRQFFFSLMQNYCGCLILFGGWVFILSFLGAWIWFGVDFILYFSLEHNGGLTFNFTSMNL